MEQENLRNSQHVVVRGSQIRLSELVVIIALVGFLLVFGPLGHTAISNDLIIRDNIRRLTGLTSERIYLEHDLSEWREKAAIAGTLRKFTRNRLAPVSVAMLADLVFENAKQYGYDPFLVLAVIHVESVFDPEARGQFRDGAHSGALGLMQLKFATAQEVAEDLGMSIQSREDLFVPETNIALGVAYLTRLITKFQDLRLGILAYNQGPETVRESLKGKRPFSIKYYNKVLRSYRRLKATHESGRET